MIRKIELVLTSVVLFAGTSSLPARAQTKVEGPGWVAASNKYSRMLLTVEMKHHPEAGSAQGLSEYDGKAVQPTLADEDQERQETATVLAELKKAVGQEKQPEVTQDLRIIIRRVDLRFRQQNFQRARVVPFLNASGAVFAGLRVLLDEQTPAERRPAAVVRIREYAGLDAGYKPIAEILK